MPAAPLASAASAHTTPDDVLSAVNVAPVMFLDNGKGAQSLASKARKPRSKRPSARAMNSKNTVISRDGNLGITSDDGDDEGNDGDEPEEGKRRARGRPRIDISDVSAADRRRTQIRLAQRAYRNRKENAIVSLEKRVEVLKEANEAMSNAFMALHDYAIEHGLLDAHPGLARQLRQTTEVFLEMARQSSGDEDMDENENENGEESTADYRTDKKPSQLQSMTVDDMAFRKKQQGIAEAVKTFGYQVTHQPQQSDVTAPDSLNQDMAIQQAQQIQEQLYRGGVTQTQQQDQQQYISGHSRSVFGSGFGPALDVVNAASPVSTSPAETLPPLSYVSSARDADALLLGNDASSRGSVTLSDSPMSGPANNDFGSAFGDPFAFDGSPLSLFSGYPLPPMQDSSAPDSTAVVTSTSDLGPHLADTDAFIAMASIGDPFPGLSLPLHVDIPNISFGLRLRRYAQECAYDLISRPNPPSDAISRAFGFCIRFEPIDAIRRRLGRDLEKPLSPDKFTRWDLPFVAKTPQPEENLPPYWEASALLFASSASQSAALSRDHGSGTLQTAGNDHRGRGVQAVTPLINVTLPGFEGSFFDCEETDRYLQQRGVHIPPNTESMIVEVDDADFALDDAATDTRTASESGRGSEPSMTGVATRQQSQKANSSGSRSNNHPSNYPEPRPPRGGTGQDVGFAGNTQDDVLASFLSSSLFSFEAPLQSRAAGLQRRVLMLDVRKLLRELVRRGTCLGQTPGFRPADVNAAFHMATRDTVSI
ncbi:hypothetical protein SEPCBS119000_000027 [Sporothrix epigloea]|uniref:BZIP domain-containing protein n=1 Tax=Sporothrix epigloea TaxID=1892477 RepID=A0ABP0D4N0_9PEZI